MSDTGKGGRPSRYSRELGEAICERLIHGESLRAVCRDPAMPSLATICRWLRADPGFREQYSLLTPMLFTLAGESRSLPAR